MNLPPSFPSAKTHARGNRQGGFTLIELLVAIAILLIIVLLFGQMLAIMSKAWTYGHGRANNFTKARAMLELMSQDLQSAVLRTDLPAFPVGGSGVLGTSSTPPVWEFYTGRPGIPLASTPTSSLPGALRNVSIVDYTLIQKTTPSISYALERADYPILWADETTNPGFGNTTPTGFPQSPTQRDTAPGVIAFEIIFIQSDGSFSTTYTPISTGGVANALPTRAVSVSLAVINDLTIKQLSPAQLTSLNTSLIGLIPATPVHSVKSYWDTYLNGGAMPWATYPKALGAGLATFERYIILPNAP